MSALLLILSVVAPLQTTYAQAPVLISALAYYGYEGNADEGVQIVNVSDAPIALGPDWQLLDANNRSWRFPHYTLSPGERLWIANNAAAFERQFGFSPTLSYEGALLFANTGGSVRLVRHAPILVDTANDDGGGWPAGSGSPTYRSMERRDSSAPDTDANWSSADPPAPIAFDGGGNPIMGTPGARNSVAITPSVHVTLSVVINEVAWGGTRYNANHEWIELFNNLETPVNLNEWQLEIIATSPTTITLSGTIPARGYFLLQRSANTFSSGAQANQTASFSLPNTGARLRLINPQREVVDTLVYGNGTPQAGWEGPPLQPYTVTHTIPAEGQVLMRRLDEATGLPVPDTNRAEDWFNHFGDPLVMRRPIYPGWRMESFFQPVSGTGHVQIAIAPDASFEFVHRALSETTHSIDLESFTFDQPALGELLAQKAAQGVVVRVLLDGAPVGGLPDQTRWICQQITRADITGRSGCWFMRSDANQNIRARYAFLHAKFAILDQQRLLISTENFSLRGMPHDDKLDGTAGQRGVVLLTDAAPLVARASAIFEADFNHRDITRWCETCAPFGAPPPTFEPITVSGGTSYTVRFGAVFSTTQPATLTLYTSPESHLRARDGLFALLALAGEGDEILAHQLSEHPFWGALSSDPVSAPNLRLFALSQAAARGARVRLLLDQHYDDPLAPRSNFATAQYLNALAASHAWDLRALRGNPTGLGIHNKMFLLRIGGRAWAHIGSWNGTETSAKRNREMSVLVESEEVFAFLREVFRGDYQFAQPIFLPLAMARYRPIHYALISEIMINPRGGDESGREWIEIYNPTGQPIDLSGYKIGDAASPSTSPFEGMFVFPAGTVLPAGRVLVIAQNAVRFREEWGFRPHFELSDYDPNVPELLPYASWATGTISLANTGDEVVLLDVNDRVVDGVAWLSGSLQNVVSYSQPLEAGTSLQRWPPGADTDNCNVDFRLAQQPTPGRVP